MVDRTSSYLKFLPAALWQNDPPASPFSLGSMLCIFEKFLTGLDDGPIVAGDRQYDPIQKVIADTIRLYQPWAAPLTVLDWLAQWVALQFPTAPQAGGSSSTPIWDEFHRRKAIAEIAQIYDHRGTKAGLARLLDLYVRSQIRPRIVIDDGSKVLFCRPVPGQLAPISTLISQMPLVAPRCVALAPPDGYDYLFVGDVGTPPQSTFENLPQIPAGVWQFCLGPRSNTPPAPPSNWITQALQPQQLALQPTLPIALAVDSTSDPWSLYVLDRATPPALFRLTSPGFTGAIKIQLDSLVFPVAMTMSGKDPWILDRGATPGGASSVRILDLTVSPPGVTHTLQVSQPSPTLEPLSMLLRRDGTLLIGHGGNPADLFQVTPTNNPTWLATSLLHGVQAAQNPLVAPTAMVEEDANHLLVLDAGLKPFYPTLDSDPNTPKIAQQPTIYRVDLSPSLQSPPMPPVITRATQTGRLVYPRDMVRGSDGQLHLCDSGMPDVGATAYRQYRALRRTFSVYLHFADGTPPASKQEILQAISDAIAEETPAHGFGVVPPLS
jgi:phage tail-like protein